MADSDKKLQIDVEKTAFYSSILHIGTYMFGAALILTFPSGFSWKGVWYPQRQPSELVPATVISLIVASCLDLMASILLFVGAKVKRKFLLSPSMLLIRLHCMYTIIIISFTVVYFVAHANAMKIFKTEESGGIFIYVLSLVAAIFVIVLMKVLLT